MEVGELVALAGQHHADLLLVDVEELLVRIGDARHALAVRLAHHETEHVAVLIPELDEFSGGEVPAESGARARVGDVLDFGHTLRRREECG